MTTTTTTNPTPFGKSVDAIRGLRDGADRWTLADSLLDEVGQYDSRQKFESVRVAAESAGVEPLSVSALRQYRDVAVHWPPADRIPGVSFSAHRAAVPADDPAGLLGDLVDAHGPNGVTVKKVKSAVAVTSGQTAPKSGTGASADVKSAKSAQLIGELARRERADVVAELSADSTVSHVAVTLMTDLLAELNAAANRSARKSANWGADPTPAKSADPTPAKSAKSAKSGQRRPGDVRGL